ncbi:hypothetical protein J5N97_025484 [Dioscorea zingiberensis]|uniref:Uncharacterized protein n=1 Tax=Dioscorea zingiberensis TaxID=325984 RepID=A0A9D5H9W0_9LILI|nr:hypothetical protein J5N97_025484 [Dioscorea zingiberensis]
MAKYIVGCEFNGDDISTKCLLLSVLSSLRPEIWQTDTTTTPSSSDIDEARGTSAGQIQDCRLVCILRSRRIAELS